MIRVRFEEVFTTAMAPTVRVLAAPTVARPLPSATSACVSLYGRTELCKNEITIGKVIVFNRKNCIIKLVKNSQIKLRKFN